MDSKHIVGNSFVFIDGIRLAGVTFEGTPIPNIISGIAVLEYYMHVDDEGQRVIDSTWYGKNEYHEYVVVMSNDFRWTYAAQIEDYKIQLNPVIKVRCVLKLIGDCKYERLGSENPLEICKNF